MIRQTQTLAQKIADELLAYIQKNNYRAGDKIPTEKELCQLMGAGRNTIREAIKILVSRNILTVRQGSGAYISEKQGLVDDPLGFSLVKDPLKLVNDLIEIREMMEPSFAGLAASNATPKEVAELEEILLEMEERIKAREDYAGLDVKFHSKIAECTHNSVMGNLIPVISQGVLIYAELVQETEYEETMKAHRRIFEAIKNHRPYEAEREMSFHLLYNDKRYKR